MPGPHERVREFVTVVEAVRSRRQAEHKRRTHQSRRRRDAPLRRYETGKTFSQEDLDSKGYSSYLNLLHGRVQYLPPRNVVMALADYLECTLEERNRILVAAGYAPEVPYLTGQSLKDALQLAEQIMAYLPVPALVVTRDWNIHGWNDWMLKLFDVSREEVERIPPEKLNILHLVFDQEVPIYERLRGDAAAWQQSAVLNIYAFKLQNLLCQYDDWYRERVEGLMPLPGFAAFWEAVNIDTPLQPVPGQSSRFVPYHFAVTWRDGTMFRLMGIHADLGTFEFPMMALYLPFDEETRRAFVRNGLPVPENRWGADGCIVT